jgi:hypothetical protein
MSLWRIVPLMLVVLAMPKEARPQQNVFAKETIESLRGFGISPFPRVVMEGEQGRLKSNEFARAVRYDSDREELWVSKRIAQMEGRDIRDIIDHEVSHLRAWRDHGIEIHEHGPEWLKVCRAHAKDPQAACVTYRPAFR